MLRTTGKMALPNMGRSYPDRSSLDDKYRFKPLPVTEAEATSTAFVCEFTGSSSANETGVGGGLSGADLVFTQYGGVLAAASGYRQLTKSAGMAFVPTVGFVNNFMRSAAGMSALWLLKDLDIGTGENHLAYLISSTLGVDVRIYTNSVNRRSTSLKFDATTTGDACGAGLSNMDVSSSNGADPTFLMMVSLDYATRTTFCGIKIGHSQPTKLSDMLLFGMNRGDAVFPGSSVISGFSAGADSIVGGRIGVNGVGVKVCSITVAKYPCFVPV